VRDPRPQYRPAPHPREAQIKSAGGFSIDCNDGGSHLDFFTKRAPGLEPVAWQLFKDHPYGIKPEPYTSVPASFPAYCQLGPRAATGDCHEGEDLRAPVGIWLLFAPNMGPGGAMLLTSKF
jgi:hypothetical protein